MGLDLGHRGGHQSEFGLGAAKARRVLNRDPEFVLAGPAALTALGQVASLAPVLGAPANLDEFIKKLASLESVELSKMLKSSKETPENDKEIQQKVKEIERKIKREVNEAQEAERNRVPKKS